MAIINKQKMYQALTQPFLPAEDSLANLADMIERKDSEGIKSAINAVLGLVHKAQHNQEFGEKAITVAGEYNGVNAGDYKDLFNELQADMEWMRFYKMVDATGANRAEIFDFNSVITWDEYEDGEKIHMKPLGSETYAELRARRFAVGVQMLRRWLSTNARYSVADVLDAIRYANITEKADFAYTQLFTVGGSATQAFATDIITTINNAANTLLTGLGGAGFNISASTPMLLLANNTHRAAINAALDTVRNMGAGSEIVNEYNIRAVYTLNANVTAQIAATNAGMLIVPGYKNVWATFDPVAVKQDPMFDTDSIEIRAQEYWNAQVDDAQKIVVNLA